MSETIMDTLDAFEVAVRSHESAGTRTVAEARRDLEIARAAVLARMLPGWQSIDNAPNEGKVWVKGGPFDEPRIIDADGKWWRRDRDAGRRTPTHWANCAPPTYDAPRTTPEPPR